MHRGSCLCGAISFEISGELGDAYFCHCQRCRKAGGSAFAANARIRPDQFKLLSGAELLKIYFNEQTGLQRKFCGQCGSPVVSERTNPPLLAVRLGSLDTPLAQGPKAHIFVASKAQWDHITDALPQFAERPI